MNSETKYFLKTVQVQEEIDMLGSGNTKDIYEKKDLVQILNSCFNEEYRDYISKKVFFPGCPLYIYQEHYFNRLQNYLELYPDADEYYFLIDELKSIKKIGSSKDYYSFLPDLYQEPHIKNLNLSSEAVRNFIFDKFLESPHYTLEFEDPNHEVFLLDGVPAEVKSLGYWFLEPVKRFNKNKSEKKTKSSDTDEVKDYTITFKDLFQEEKLYDKALNLLLDNEFLSKARDGKWKLSNNAKPGGLSETKIISALGYVLYWKEYFRDGIDIKSIQKGLNDFFSLNLTYHTYRKNHVEFEDAEESSRLGGAPIKNTKSYEYLSIFHIIKPQQHRYNQS